MKHLDLKLANKIKDLLSELEFTSPCGEDKDMYDIFIYRILELLEKEVK